MKLIFSRQQDTIVTQLEQDGDIQEFDYLVLINKLIEGDTLEESVYPDDITDPEKTEINQMVEKINEVISLQDAENEEDVDALE